MCWRGNGKEPLFCTFEYIIRSLSPSYMDIFYWKSKWICVMNMCHENMQVKLKLGFRWIIFSRAMPLWQGRFQLKFGIKMIEFLLISIIIGYFQLKIRMKICHENMQVKFQFGSRRITFSRVWHSSAHYLPHNGYFRLKTCQPVDIVLQCIVIPPPPPPTTKLYPPPPQQS